MPQNSSKTSVSESEHVTPGSGVSAAVTNHGHSGALARLSALDTVRVVAGVLAPTVAVGTIARRPAVFRVADRMEADRRALRLLQRLRDEHGPGPARLAIPGRNFAVVLAPDDVHRVLGEGPEPFSPANREKRGALAHFQPHGVLISSPDERPARRAFNEAVLATGCPVHPLAASLMPKVREEAAHLAAADTFTSQDFIAAWLRVIRRVTLGDAARDDQEFSGLINRLRREGNWGPFAPRRNRIYRKFHQQLAGYLRAAEPGSLAELVASTPAFPGVDRQQQVPQWLFAFDPAGLVTIRALALLSEFPGYLRTVREQTPQDGPGDNEALRATVLESARLWPTTPAILRDTTATTHWPGGTLPAGTGVLIWAPLFHRDDQHLPFADTFAPQIWSDEGAHSNWPLVPFSEGPAVCPGQDLVLQTASTFLAELLHQRDYRLRRPEHLIRNGRLPMTLNPYDLTFERQPTQLKDARGT
jgi:cytochrome P450